MGRGRRGKDFFRAFNAWQAEGEGSLPLPVLLSVRGRVQSSVARGRRGIKVQVDETGAKGAFASLIA